MPTNPFGFAAHLNFVQIVPWSVSLSRKRKAAVAGGRITDLPTPHIFIYAAWLKYISGRTLRLFINTISQISGALQSDFTLSKS